MQAEISSTGQGIRSTAGAADAEAAGDAHIGVSQVGVVSERTRVRGPDVFRSGGRNCCRFAVRPALVGQITSCGLYWWQIPYLGLGEAEFYAVIDACDGADRNGDPLLAP